MRGTGISTSLLLIATGAVLVWGVHLRSTSVDLGAIGAILMVVGIIGISLSFLFAADFGDWFGVAQHHHRGNRSDVTYDDDVDGTRPEPVTRIR